MVNSALILISEFESLTKGDDTITDERCDCILQGVALDVPFAEENCLPAQNVAQDAAGRSVNYGDHLSKKKQQH